IYAGDGNRLSLAATFPQLRETELRYGSLTRGMLHALRDNGKGHQPAQRRPASAFLTPRTGLAEIIEALERRLAGADVRKGTAAVRVEPLPGEGYRVRLAGRDWIETSSVILATPAFVSAQLVEGLDARMAADLESIPYASTATVSLAFPLSAIPRALDGYGYIVPQAEGRPILACTWTSTKFPHRAPDGFALIRAFIGRAGKEDLLEADDQALVHVVRTELEQVMGVRAAPILQRVFRWPQAMPQYILGHPDRLASIERGLHAHPGMQLAGSAYRGIGLPDCIASGEAAATAALSHVQSMERERSR
ncbi:MAG: protoporphyrinogen oxidase, partial [Anaerolineales bacterium]|nr:protoporphyrinogen oxidase [Anaerolineales bacterium]